MSGLLALVGCLFVETSAIVTAIVPVALGVCVMQGVLGVMKRRAWQRANAERD